jgi:transketolase
MELKNRDFRDIYTDLLIKYAEENENLVIVEADLMTALATTRFQKAFPERTVNVGVAEANMIGVAAGLSNMGKIPFTHTFTPFATRRVFDQVMLSVAYSKLNVKMVGSDPGIVAQLNGGTHMSFEDVGIMRNIPTMTIFEPVDGVQLHNMFPEIMKHYGPLYIRLGRKEFDPIFDENQKFELGKAISIKDGKDVTIFATGIMVSEALKAEKSLSEKGISVSIVNIHTVKPIDVDCIIKEAKKTKAIVVAENHNIINGLGSAVAEVLGEHCPVPMERVGVKDVFGEVGKLPYLMERFELTASHIEAAVLRVLKRKN